jgi:hypothetical protein
MQGLFKDEGRPSQVKLGTQRRSGTIERRIRMIRKYVGAPFLTLALVLAASVVAMAKNSHTLTIEAASLNGAQINSGQYQVQYETHSPAATVQVMKEHKVIATADGQVVDRGVKYQKNTVVYSIRPDGSHAIDEIRFAGSSQVIVFGS